METDVLRKCLQDQPQSIWRDHAIEVLNEGDVLYTGSGEPKRFSTSKDMFDLYHLRLEIGREKRTDVVGMEELVDRFKSMSNSDRVYGRPFAGPKGFIYSFWDENDSLIGCISGKGVFGGRSVP